MTRQVHEPPFPDGRLARDTDPSVDPGHRFDVIVIGAGVVGCAVARRLALAGAEVLVVEKAADILDGASKGNSAILHTGFDAPPGSLEQSCIAEGYAEFLDIHERLNLPLVRSGALVVAWTPEQEARLDGIVEQAHRNDVEDVVRISIEEAGNREPGLGPGALGAVSVPGESLVDPWSTPFAYLLQAMAHGTRVLRGCVVENGSFDGGCWTLQTNQGELTTTHVVNCAGLYGDLVHRALSGDEAEFHIHPRKGQFVVYDKSACALSSSILLPVPTETTKGIVVCPTVFGNLLVGPTAEDQESRDDASVEADTLAMLKREGERILPALAGHAVTAIYAGLRPATERKEYRVLEDAARNYLCLGGIRSTGLSAALGLANIAARWLTDGGSAFVPPRAIDWPAAPAISEHGERDWMRAGNDGMVCHCELVTRREVLAALDGPLPARSLAGLKRRTRVTMGRCQGFYCSAELADLAADRFEEPLARAPEEATG